MAANVGLSREIAFAYWIGLGPGKRSYQRTAKRFGVSRQRIGRIALEDNWAERADREDVKTAAIVLRRLARSRAERLTATLEIYDRANDLALAKLPLDADGNLDVAKLGEQAPKLDTLFSSLPGLFKMAELAAGEATDRVALAEVQPVLVNLAKIAVVNCLPDQRGDVLRQIEQALGGLTSATGILEAAA